MRLVVRHSSSLRTSLFRFYVSALVGVVMLEDAGLGRMSLAPQSAGKSHSVLAGPLAPVPLLAGRACAGTGICRTALSGADCGWGTMQGQVFAVGLNGGVIKVYDARGYQAGPFCTWAVCTH